MSAGFLLNVSSCAWVWCVCICFERGFEPNSPKLTWGELKHNLVAGPAPHETADPVLKCEVEWGWARMLPQPCRGLCWDAAEPEFCSGGVFSKVAALSLWALSEKDVRLPFCSWFVCVCSLAAQQCPHCHLSSVQTGLSPQIVYSRGCLLLSDSRGGQTAGA